MRAEPGSLKPLLLFLAGLCCCESSRFRPPSAPPPPTHSHSLHNHKLWNVQGGKAKTDATAAARLGRTRRTSKTPRACLEYWARERRVDAEYHLGAKRRGNDGAGELERYKKKKLVKS